MTSKTVTANIMTQQKITRRGLLGAVAASSAVACSPKVSETLTAASPSVNAYFNHGVASGDPSGNAVILWTRITPENSNAGDMGVAWSLSSSEDFSAIIASGTVMTQAARDWTVKVDASGLESGQTYYYRFQYNGETSPIGQTKTLPEGDVESVRFAVTSCANWQHGFFNTYDHISRQDHFDALLHLGDYYYEYGVDTSFDAEAAKQGRLHEPAHEIITLDDYRTRIAQYRTDASLQAMNAKLPMIAIWDDHETSNDSWRAGAENHNDNYGDLLSLVTVETRLLARDEPLIIEEYFDMLRDDGGTKRFNEILFDENRDMLGEAQTDFIVDTLTASKAAGQSWRMLANQVVIGRVTSPDLTPHVTAEALDGMAKAWPAVRDFVEFSKYNLPTYTDSWDGYPAARNKFYDRLSAAGINDLVVVTGDSHEFWVNDLTDKGGAPMGVELGTTAVCSKTLVDYMGPTTEDYALLMTQHNKDVRYYNPMRSGYLDVEFSKKTGTARLISVDTRLSKDYKAEMTAQFTLRPTSNGSVKFAAPKGLNLKQRALFSGLG